ncbi:MAG: hypothetical protein K6V97_03990 [Actinomycetia bacterium]|nr:hypothetical protein [Actinomycetes bacterium]
MDAAQRAYCVHRFERYWDEQARFRELTKWEYDGMPVPLPPEFPTDSVRSARLDGLPQARVAFGSNPTLRVVMQREEILRRVARLQAEGQARLRWLTDRMLGMWEFWQTLNQREQWFIQWHWWERMSLAEVAEAFVAHRDWFEAPGPESERTAERWREDLLERAAWAWLGNGPPPPEPPDPPVPDPDRLRSA